MPGEPSAEPPGEPPAVLVTGSSGAVGTRVCEQLIAEGRTVVGYDRRPPDESMEGPGTLIPVDGDVLDDEALAATIARYAVDSVVHAAAILPAERTRLSDVVSVNVAGTAAVAEASAAAGVTRLVFTSTKGVYADFVGDYGHPTFEPIDEGYPLIDVENTHTLYNATKLAAEYCLVKMSDITGLQVAVLRFATMYGPKRERHGTRSIAGDIVKNMAAGEDVHIGHGGDQRFDLIYVKDVARSIVAALRAERVDLRFYNIGSGRLVSLLDVAAAARQVLPDSPSKVHIGPGLDPMQLGWPNYGVFDISRAQDELGFTPAYDLLSGVTDYVESLRLDGRHP